jgi:hypothetical protein
VTVLGVVDGGRVGGQVFADAVGRCRGREAVGETHGLEIDQCGDQAQLPWFEAGVQECNEHGLVDRDGAFLGGGASEDQWEHALVPGVARGERPEQPRDTLAPVDDRGP